MATKITVVLEDDRTDDWGFLVHCRTDCEFYYEEGCRHTRIRLDKEDNCLSFKKGKKIIRCDDCGSDLGLFQDQEVIYCPACNKNVPVFPEMLSDLIEKEVN